MRVVAHHAHARLRHIRMHQLARRNRIQPRHQPLQHIEQLLRLFTAPGKIREQIDELAPPAIVLRARLVLRPAQQLQLARTRARPRPPRPAAWHTAQSLPRASLPIVSRVPQRLFKADLNLVVVQHPLVAAKPQRLQHLRHRLRAILRKHPNRIARRIRHPRLQRERKMPRLLLRALAAQKVVRHHSGIDMGCCVCTSEPPDRRYAVLGGHRRPQPRSCERLYPALHRSLTIPSPRHFRPRDQQAQLPLPAADLRTTTT